MLELKNGPSVRQSETAVKHLCTVSTRIYINAVLYTFRIYTHQRAWTLLLEGRVIHTYMYCNRGNTVMFTFQIYIHQPVGTLDVYISVLTLYWPVRNVV